MKHNTINATTLNILLVYLSIGGFITSCNHKEEINHLFTEDQKTTFVFSVYEYSSIGTIVGEVLVAAEDAYSPFTYKIISEQEYDTFSIDTKTGIISVNNNKALHYSENQQFQLEVEAKDNAGHDIFLLVVIEVKQAPFIIEPQEFSLYENSSPGTIVGNIEATINIPGSEIEYEITDSEGPNIFEIGNGNNNIIIFGDNIEIDYEKHKSFTFYVIGKTAEYESTPVKIQINILDILEANILNQDQEFTIPEYSEKGTYVGKVEVEKYDPNQEIIFRLYYGNENGAFKIDPLTGEITVAIPNLLNSDIQKVIEVQPLVSNKPETNNQYTINTIKIIDTPKQGSITDIDGNIYPIVYIGDQA